MVIFFDLNVFYHLQKKKQLFDFLYNKHVVYILRDTTIYFRYKFGIKMIHVMITRLLFPERTFQSITIWIPVCTYKWKSTHLHNTYWHISLNSSISTHLYINRLICRLSCSICNIWFCVYAVSATINNLSFSICFDVVLFQIIAIKRQVNTLSAFFL